MFSPDFLKMPPRESNSAINYVTPPLALTSSPILPDFPSSGQKNKIIPMEEYWIYVTLSLIILYVVVYESRIFTNKSHFLYFSIVIIILL